MTDYKKPFPCKFCGQIIMATENHTLNDCIIFIKNNKKLSFFEWTQLGLDLQKLKEKS